MCIYLIYMHIYVYITNIYILYMYIYIYICIYIYINSNMLASFNALPHMNFRWSNGIVSLPESIGEPPFSKNLSMGDRRQTF